MQALNVCADPASHIETSYLQLPPALSPSSPGHQKPPTLPELVPLIWKGLVGVGLFALAHAAFSADQHRSYMQLTEKEDETLPIDIILQTLLAFVVACYSIVHIAGEFKDMDATSELQNKALDTLKNHPSFYVFNHRGPVMFQSPDTKDFQQNQAAFTSNAPLKLRKLESLQR
ncbi:ER membrane protein complex subunit 5-B-like [Rana temporaria]|uniref:ER membrane protein complex subunit 5-B-like n=1 Tax=Rana temporaria TaxID=8407 RepID=UPI001AAD5943|nr:ER membrane protein complex subunit 5-B-like [Rana temporaria]